MRTTILRVLGAVVGLSAALAAMVVPPLVIFQELQGADSSGRALGISMAVLILAGFLAFIAYRLLRFALRGVDAAER